MDIIIMHLSPIPARKISIALAGDYSGDFAKHGFDIRVTFCCVGILSFAGAFVVSGVQSCLLQRYENHNLIVGKQAKAMQAEKKMAQYGNGEITRDQLSQYLNSL